MLPHHLFKFKCKIFAQKEVIHSFKKTRRCGSVYLGVVVLAYVKFVMCMRDMWVV